MVMVRINDVLQSSNELTGSAKQTRHLVMKTYLILYCIDKLSDIDGNLSDKNCELGQSCGQQKNISGVTLY